MGEKSFNSGMLRFSLLLLVVCLALTSCAEINQTAPIRVEDYSGKIRVACVGDSITFGSGIKDRAARSYPAQLGALLGEKWEVRNFGVGGATMVKKGDKPYWKQGRFAEAMAFNPHVVIVKLGTNDSKPQNWKFAGEFGADYADMIERFSLLSARPRIYVCLPVPVYEDRWGIRESVVKNEAIPILMRVAEEKEVQTIDLYAALSGKRGLFPDRIHPNAEGAGVMAGVIYEVLTGEKAPAR